MVKYSAMAIEYREVTRPLFVQENPSMNGAIQYYLTTSPKGRTLEVGLHFFPLPEAHETIAVRVLKNGNGLTRVLHEGEIYTNDFRANTTPARLAQGEPMQVVFDSSPGAVTKRVAHILLHNPGKSPRA